MNDEQVQAKYRQYCDQYKDSKCPDCSHVLMVTINQWHNSTDDLMSTVQLDCSQCHWSKRIDKPYSDCIK